MPFQDKNEFEAGDPEDKSQTGAFPEESPDDEEKRSEEELAIEMEPFTVADWKQEIPDYTAEEFEEKLPDRTRARWMSPVLSCLFGTLLGAAIAGVNVNDLPRPQQVRTFIIFFLFLAPVFSLFWHWLFYLRPKQLTARMREQQVNPIGSDPIPPNEELQQANPVGSEPIHPK